MNNNECKTDEELFKKSYNSDWYPSEAKTKLQSLTPKKDKLYNTVIKFMSNNGIRCAESIYQCDWVDENALVLIEDLFNIVKDDLDLEDDE